MSSGRYNRPALAHFLRDGVTPKKAFTHHEALVKRREMEDFDFFERRIFHSYIDAYECPACGAWHLGQHEQVESSEPATLGRGRPTPSLSTSTGRQGFLLRFR